MTAINEDRHLLGLFLRELVKVKPPVDPRKLTVLEQQYPGEDELSEDEIERQGIPDGWIFDDEGWCVFIETKVLAKLGADQINRHRGTARRRGFDDVVAVAIAPRRYLPTSRPGRHCAPGMARRVRVAPASIARTAKNGLRGRRNIWRLPRQN